MKLTFDEIRAIFMMADIARNEICLDNFNTKPILKKLFKQLNSNEQVELKEEFKWIRCELK